jgi:hypothetical protein
MTAPVAVGIALATIAILELASYALAAISAHILSKPIARRSTILADQTTKLDRLANAEGIRPRIHPVLGWDYHSSISLESGTLNAMGLRSVREYDVDPPPGIKRIAAFGDSFVYCGEASDEQCWPAQIESGWRAEVLNYGVGGYGPDQVYLRYLAEGNRLKPEIVLIGFIAIMASRVVSRYRRFQAPEDGPWFKPRFVIDGDDLRLIPPPVGSRQEAARLLANPGLVKEIGSSDYWYSPAVYEHRLHDWSATYRVLTHFLSRFHRRYVHRDRILKGRSLNADAESFKILTRLYGKFAEAVRANGSDPIIVLFPTRSDLEMHVKSRETSYQPLAAWFSENGLRFIDLAEPLIASGKSIPDMYAPGGHYSGRGNALVAQAIAQALALPRRE